MGNGKRNYDRGSHGTRDSEKVIVNKDDVTYSERKWPEPVRDTIPPPKPPDNEKK